jgi:hypothetical protein
MATSETSAAHLVGRRYEREVGLVKGWWLAELIHEQRSLNGQQRGQCSDNAICSPMHANGRMRVIRRSFIFSTREEDCTAEFVMMAKQVLQLRYQPRISRLDPVGEAAFSFDICSVFVEMDAERGESPDKLRARGTAAHGSPLLKR